MDKKIRNAFYGIGLVLILVSVVVTCIKLPGLPNTVPVQTGTGGVITSYGSKYMLLLFPILMVICLFVPQLNKLSLKTKKYSLVGVRKSKYVNENTLAYLGLILMLLLLVVKEPFYIW